MIIKPADKGSLVVVMDHEQYVREAMRQIFCEEMQELIFPELVELIRGKLGQLWDIPREGRVD